MCKFKFTGKETPQELRQALVDCGDLMTKMYIEAQKDQGKVETFLLVKTFQNEILEKMAGDTPFVCTPARDNLPS